MVLNTWNLYNFTQEAAQDGKGKKENKKTTTLLNFEFEWTRSKAR